MVHPILAMMEIPRGSMRYARIMPQLIWAVHNILERGHSPPLDIARLITAVAGVVVDTIRWFARARSAMRREREAGKKGGKAQARGPWTTFATGSSVRLKGG
jgi:hypothetical protein